MITAIDTNVLVALWDHDEKLNSAALTALDNAFAAGRLVISGAVFAELMAFPKRTEKFLNDFLGDTQIEVDWATDEKIWRSAGRAFKHMQIADESSYRMGHAGSWPTFLLGPMLLKTATVY